MRDRGQIPPQELKFTKPQESRELTGKVYVEVGSGGTPAFFISGRKINPGDRYTTIDIRDHEAKTSKIFGEDWFESGFEAIQGDASDLPFADSSVDEMIFNNVFGDPSTRDRERLLLEAARVLKAGGQVVITEYITPAIFFKFFGESQEKIEKYLQENSIDLKVKNISTADADINNYVGNRIKSGVPNSGFQLILEK